MEEPAAPIALTQVSMLVLMPGAMPAKDTKCGSRHASVTFGGKRSLYAYCVELETRKVEVISPNETTTNGAFASEPK